MRRIASLALPAFALALLLPAPASAAHQCKPNEVPTHVNGQDLCLPASSLVCTTLPPGMCS